VIAEAVGLAPNPQFSRDGWIDLTGEWRFGFDDAGIGHAERWFEQPERLTERITVPYTPESRLSGIHDATHHHTLWYARTFDIPYLFDGQRLRLNFGAVDYTANVWVDGSWVGQHTGGHTPFAFDITDALRGSGEHWIVVRAEDDPLDAEQPRGKQGWQATPHEIWYERTSGIWQAVWLEITPAIRIESVRWGFDPSRWAIEYDVALSHRASEGSTLALAFEHGDRRLPDVRIAATGRVISGTIGLMGSREIMNPKTTLWAPRHPNLIGARITLSAPGQMDDVVSSYLGLRSITTTSRGVRINGLPVFLRLVLQQAYWPESQLVPPSPEALEHEADLILALGFNGARIHQKVEDPRFLYHADRKGLLLWDEMPSPFTFSERGIERHAREWRDVVMRDRNHPSVIAWTPFNESWGVNELGLHAPQQHAVKAAYHLTHHLDGSRPVIGNDGWENVASDIFTIHDYTWDADLLRRRYASADALRNTCETHYPGSRALIACDFEPDGKPVMVTEYGGVGYAPPDDEDWYGYGKVETTEEFIAQYRALTNALLESDLLAGFCYTQFTDTLQETNGLLTETREPKVPIETIRAITRGE
jgi:beta-galactosidase/beta-glucuronidase